MKETDIQLVLQETTTQLENHWHELPFNTYLTLAQATTYVMTIYYHNDMAKVVGADVVIGDDAISWLANGRRMVCFINHRRTWANSDYQSICMYQNLTEDITNIIFLMGSTFQAALEAL